MKTHHAASVSFVAVLLALAARAQEPEPAPEKPAVPPPARIQPPQDDVQKEMLELSGKVERELRAIDKLLQEAARAPSGREAGSLAEQLRNAQASGESVKAGIDRILELAASQSPSSSSSGQGEPQQGQGQNPMDRQGEQSTGREQTPSRPEQGGEKPEPGGEKPGEQGPKPGEEKKPGAEKDPAQQGRDPKDGPERSKADPEQRPGADPARGAQGAAGSAQDGRDRWGDLPFHAREVFRNEGGRDMPPLYREWIDAYYKRLNRQP
jgi:hypothetical protein